MAHGAWAVRFYRQESIGSGLTDLEGYGRAWVLVDKPEPGELMVFNVYGVTPAELIANLEHWLGKHTGLSYKGNTVSVNAYAYEPLYLNQDARIFTTTPDRKLGSWSWNIGDLLGYDGDFKREWYNLIPGFRPRHDYDDDDEEEEPEEESEEEPEEEPLPEPGW
jgi:hypothetical protein